VSNSTLDLIAMNRGEISTNLHSAPLGLSFAPVSVGPLFLQMQAVACPWYEETHGSGIDIFASNRTLFQPESSKFTLSLAGQASFNYSNDEQDMRFSLRDVTTSTLLLDFKASSDWAAWFGAPAEFAFTFPANLSHEYELTMTGWINAFDAKESTMAASARITMVPEPGGLSFLATAFGSLYFNRATKRAKR
jgi:hypothetical protein